MLSLFRLCVFVALVILIVCVCRVHWQTETFETQCPTLSFIENQVEYYNDDNVRRTEEEFIQNGLEQINTVLNNIHHKHKNCTLSAHYEDQITVVSKVITNQTTEEEKKSFLKLAYQNRSDVNFNACLNGSRYMGTTSGAICKPDSSSSSVDSTGGSQGCNEHSSNEACLNDTKCVLYRKSGGSGKALCYPKCSTITNADECNNNSRNFCEYKDGKCKYKCSNFNAKSTLDNLNACQMSEGCKVHHDECVETNANTPHSHQHHNKSNFPDLTIIDDPDSNMYTILNKDDKDVGNLPKCLKESTGNEQGQMVENGEGTFLCKDMNVCLDNNMLNFVAGISSELDAKKLVEKVNQRCGNNTTLD